MLPRAGYRLQVTGRAPASKLQGDQVITPNPQPSTWASPRCANNPQPGLRPAALTTSNPQPSTLNPQPSTFNFQPSTYPYPSGTPTANGER